MTSTSNTAPVYRPRLLGLEAGRFVAALLVTCFHFSLAFRDIKDVWIFDMAFRPGHAGVEYFFVLSGFIIYYIHAADIGKPEKLWGFSVKRAVRLYPMYFAVFFAMLAAFVLVPSLEGKRELTPFGLFLDLFLLPTNGDLVVLQSWSLRHEIVFYALFAIAILNARIGVTILILWQVASLVIGVLYPDSLPRAIKPFFYLYNVGFGFGIVAAWATTRWRPSRPGLIAAFGAVVFVVSMIVEWSIGRYVPEPGLPLGTIASPLLYLSSSTLIIFGLTQVEMTRPLPGEKLLGVLGGSSYLLYLSHAAIGSFLIRVFGHGALAATPNWLVFVIMVAASIGASIVAHLIIERPVLRGLRGILLPRKRAPLAA